MDIKEKLEGYFIDLSIPFEAKADDVWVITDEQRGFENVLVTSDGQVVTITVRVMSIPASDKEAFYEKLLQLNATDMIHGAYAIEGPDIVLLDSLEGPTMDLEEIQASLDAISLALSQHYPILSKYRA